MCQDHLFCIEVNIVVESCKWFGPQGVCAEQIDSEGGTERIVLSHQLCLCVSEKSFLADRKCLQSQILSDFKPLQLFSNLLDFFVVVLVMYGYNHTFICLSPYYPLSLLVL